MNDLLVKGGTLFDVGRSVETGDILVRDGRIVEIAPSIEARDATVFDARGKIVMPGFLEGFLARWKGKHPRVQPMIGPSSLPRCSTELFEASVALARGEDVGLQTHLLSGKAQVMTGQRRYGGSTASFLRRIGALAPG